jgi:hypothetical protein
MYFLMDASQKRDLVHAEGVGDSRGSSGPSGAQRARLQDDNPNLKARGPIHLGRRTAGAAVPTWSIFPPLVMAGIP